MADITNKKISFVVQGIDKFKEHAKMAKSFFNNSINAENNRKDLNRLTTTGSSRTPVEFEGTQELSLRIGSFENAKNQIVNIPLKDLSPKEINDIDQVITKYRDKCIDSGNKELENAKSFLSTKIVD